MFMEDNFRHKGLRARLVEGIRQKGIKDERVLEAINKVPRHAFMDSGFINFSYKDKAFPIGAGQTISQPYTVAFQTGLLEVNALDKVLEVGTGSGYQTAVLLELGAKVYTIERQKELYLKAQDKLPKLGYHPHFFFGDGYLGLPTYGPFDKILVTAGAPEIPNSLLHQLIIGGIMVVPVGPSNYQVMKKVKKTGEGEYNITNHGTFVFVPLMEGKSNNNNNHI